MLERMSAARAFEFRSNIPAHSRRMGGWNGLSSRRDKCPLSCASFCIMSRNSREHLRKVEIHIGFGFGKQ